MTEVAPTHDAAELTRYIEARYHTHHREQLPELAALADKVEAVHADGADVPAGLAAILRRMISEMEVHMKKEELILFPAMRKGGIATGAGLVAALAHGAQAIQCGTAFLATTESFAHDYHKQRVVEAEAADTVLTDIFVLNWPAHAAVRVIANSVTGPLGFKLLGHDPESLPREVVADEGGREIPRYSTDSPLRITTGDLEAMALFAGESVAAITDVMPAAERIRRIMAEAEACRTRLMQPSQRGGATP